MDAYGGYEAFCYGYQQTRQVTENADSMNKSKIL